MRIRRLTVLAVAAAGAGVLVYILVARHSPPASRTHTRVKLSRALIRETGIAHDELKVTVRAGSRHEPFRLSYSWLECDLVGKRCSPLRGPRTRAIVPPQKAKVVTLRGVVTATNSAGSTSLTTRNFYYDMAGLAFDGRGAFDAHPEYDPAQLRARYGLGPEQDGAGQTIVIPDVGPRRGLRAAVDHFSAHYGLPRPCRGAKGPACFQLVVSRAGPASGLVRTDEAEADVEWAHSIAPAARVVVLRFDFSHVAALLDRIAGLGRAGRASVVSNSWCEPCRGFHSFARAVVFPHIARACRVPHLVCVQATGDHGSPAETPSNSPYVLAVGGTRFGGPPGDPMRNEVPWPRSGLGDTDVPVARPAWQRNAVAGCSRVRGVFSCADRAVPDVSATAANVPVFRPIRTGFAWSYFYGTSLSAPLWAGLIALTDQALQRDGQPALGIEELHRVLYGGRVAGGLNDIPPEGWDWATGLGSPTAGIVEALTRAIEHHRRRR